MLDRSGQTRAGSARARLTELLASADIVIDGDRPWDPQIHDDRFFELAFAGSLAVGEAFMNGLWSCDQLDERVCRFRRARFADQFKLGSDGWRVLKAKLRNRQSASRSYDMGRRVYDGAIDLFEATLDPRMAASPTRPAITAATTGSSR
jgi:cyclopropane-fatty-acyl-phospholipid synthase